MLFVTILITSCLATFVLLMWAGISMPACIGWSLVTSVVLVGCLALVATKFGDDNVHTMVCDAKVVEFVRVSPDHAIGYMQDSSPVIIAASHTLKQDLYGRTPRLEILRHCSVRATGWWTGMDLKRYLAVEKSYTDTTLYIGGKE